jgi:hypothetical protein
MSCTGSLNNAGSAEAKGRRVVGSSASTPEMIQPPVQSGTLIRVGEKKKSRFGTGNDRLSGAEEPAIAKVVSMVGVMFNQMSSRRRGQGGMGLRWLAGCHVPARVGLELPKRFLGVEGIRLPPILLRPRREAARKRAPQHQVGNLVAPPWGMEALPTQREGE